jgi:putative two-component system response regulator
MSEQFAQYYTKPLILIVDDTPTILALINDILSKSYRTPIAQNGEAALELACADHPELILIDVERGSIGAQIVTTST